MKKYSFYITLAFVVSFILVLLVVYPMYKKLNSIRIDIAEKESQLAFQKDHLADLQAIYEEIEANEQAVEKVDLAIPEKAFLPDLLNFIQNTASQSGIILQNIAVRKPTSAKGKILKLSSVNLDVQGSYSDLKKFLLILENSTRIIDVQDIYFVYGGDEKTFEFSLNILVNSY